MRRKRQLKSAQAPSKVPRNSKNNRSDPQYYENIPYDSLEEKMFIFWALELKQLGYIDSIERGKSFLLSDALQNNYALQLKTKSKPKVETLMQGHSYTLDFIIHWSKLGVEKFVWTLLNRQGKCNKLFINVMNDNISYVEIKPEWDENNMTRLFKLNQKWLYDKYKIYTNLIIPDRLFKETFLPEKAKLTPTGKQRKINYKSRTVKEYLSL